MLEEQEGMGLIGTYSLQSLLVVLI